MTTAILTSGGRTYSNASRVIEALSAAPYPDMLIEGGATGADTLCRLWAESRGIQVVTMKANWSVHGRAAGPRRNGEMVRLARALAAVGWHVQVVAFPGGSGTEGCVSQALKAGLSVQRVVDG